MQASAEPPPTPHRRWPLGGPKQRAHNGDELPLSRPAYGGALFGHIQSDGPDADKDRLADALLEYASRMNSVESTAHDTNQRTRSLEESTAEINDLLVRALDR